MPPPPSRWLLPSLMRRGWSPPKTCPGGPWWMPTTLWGPWASSSRFSGRGGPWWLSRSVFPMGQFSGPFCRRFLRLDHRRMLPAAGRTVVFTWAHPSRFLLFSKIKNKLSGCTLTQETLQKSWEGVVMTIGKYDFATASRWRNERCQQCNEIGNGYV